MGEHFDRFVERIHEINDLGHVNAVLQWDQSTYMPPAGAAARGSAMGTIARIGHTLETSDETGALLEAAAEEVKDFPLESDEASLVRVFKRDYEQSRKIPAALVAEMSRHGAEAYDVWVRAKNNNDYGSFAPYLQKSIDYSRQVADYLGYDEQRYDALLDRFEPGMKTAQVQTIFEDLKKDLVPLVHAIGERVGAVSDEILHGDFDTATQLGFANTMVTAFGYDFSRGRSDPTVHPFAMAFSRDDVRITTFAQQQFLNPGIFGTLHEAGHGMYEQGVGPSLEGTVLARGASLGLHESQSRMWENVVGRSRGAWQHFYPRLQQTFPQQLGSVDLETFYRAINRVEPSLIRVEADEVTYNLHIMLRLEMELDMIDGRLSVDDAPAAWNDKMEAYLGIRPGSDSEGILQDVHWSSGLMGYFTTYSLGNILSVQLYDAAVKAGPDIPAQMNQGRFESLHGWMTENVYQYGRKLLPNEIVERATGEPIQSRSYIRYLQEKFGEIYGL